MTPTLDQLAPGFVARLNLFVDLVLLLVALKVVGFDTTGPAGLFATGAWLIVGLALKHYVAGAYRRARGLEAVVSAAMAAAVLVTLLLWITLSYTPGAAEAVAAVVLCWSSATALRLVAFRALAKGSMPREEIVIVGAGPLAMKAARRARREQRRKVLGVLPFAGEWVAVLPELGRAVELEKVLCRTPVDEVVIAGDVLTQGEEMRAAVAVCERAGVPFALPLCGVSVDRAHAAGDEGDGFVHYLGVEMKEHQRKLKRLFDVAASAAALAVLSPLLLGVAVLVKLTSRGPVLFRQTRSGLHGRPFQMLKFRSMRADAERLRATLERKNEMSGPVFKMKNDPRVTAVGRFIRKYSIDELPQLFNVLAGDMSVVGPRPPLPSEVERYQPWQRRRLSVRPGLTCIWQVSGRNQISFEEWMRLDMQYIDRWSLAGDVRLVLKTVPVVLAGRGAS